MDLPQPRKIVLTEEQATAQQWQMFVTINGLLLAYAGIHKFVMPWVRWRFSDAPVLHVDPWFLFHPMLAVWLYQRRKKLISWTSLLGLGYCSLKVAASFFELGSQKGTWMSLSAIMTEGLSLAFILPWLSWNFSERRSTWLWIVLIGGLLGGASLQWGKGGLEVAPQKRTPLATHSLTLSGPCVPSMAQGVFEILPCGLGTGTESISGPIKIQNNSGRFLNLRVELSESTFQKSRRTWRNTPLFEGQSFILDPTKLPNGTRVIVHSDAWKAAGERVFVVKADRP